VFTGGVGLLVAGILNLTLLGMRDAPLRFDPNDWGPQALAGHQLVTDPEHSCLRCHVSGGPAEDLGEIPLTRDEQWVGAHMMDPSAIAPLDRASTDPAWSPDLRPMQAQAVLAYLRRIRAGAVPPPLSDSDRIATTTFANVCASCHRISGEGGQSAPNLSRIGARRNAESIRRILVDPASEFEGATMPIFRGRLDDEQIEALTQYLVGRR
jgi:mono/diheme cytochrome c family protein